MGFWQDKIYPRLPVSAQNWAISAYGYAWHRRRFAGVFHEELKKFKERENYTVLQWQDYQTAELRRLLCHAFETVPFYREKYSKAGFGLSDFEKFELEDLKKLPYLEKEDLRRFGITTLLSSKREKGGHFFSSSGSTGTPTQILFSHPFHQRWSAAFESRIRHWAGVNRFDARGMIGGRLVVPSTQTAPPFFRVNQAENQVYFSINHLSKKNVSNYLYAIQKHNLIYMTGYASSNYLLAKYAIELGLENIALKAVITSSEKLTQQMRDTFMSLYHCKTYDSWSGIEACGLISECENGRLHISPDVGILEMLKSDGDSNAEEVICTGFLNRDQPLIRYRIGDLLELDKNDYCACGRGLPVVKSIIGRIDDIVTLRDGRQLSSFNRFFADIKGVSEVQVVQKDYDFFQLLIVPTEDYDISTLNAIQKVFIERIGLVSLDVEQVEFIPRNKNGKFKAVISEISMQ
ncbi:MAG: hypothetical protein KIPDCIKN_03897 [Haliscomenobacter sp.]|nr:hypothetical protein [Haliscomenobacter sp.]